jgi:methylglutaconyl-CoA hydratase
MESTILVERATNIVTITLNRPEARNAISRKLTAELHEALAALNDDETLRALVITGAGDRAFCAGADLVERRGLTAAELTAHTAAINEVCDLVAGFPVPTIAAIRGFALAGGAELAIACDLRVAATDAVLGFPEVKIGVFPGAGGVVRLPYLIGSGAARDLLYTGRTVAAEAAMRIGLVDRLVPSEHVVATAIDVATSIAANAPLAVRAVKRALIDAVGLPEGDAHRVVAAHRRPLDATDDYAEGLAAFAERRTPAFRGR